LVLGSAGSAAGDLCGIPEVLPQGADKQTIVKLIAWSINMSSSLSVRVLRDSGSSCAFVYVVFVSVVIEMFSWIVKPHG
jgi:hypothetical protein